MNQTVERLNLHSWHLYQSKRNFVLYKTIESFFFEIHFFSEEWIFAQKNETPDGVIFFSDFEKMKNSL